MPVNNCTVIYPHWFGFVVQEILECGKRRTYGDHAGILVLSKGLQRYRYGFEYGALEVKNHLEITLFSEMVNTVMILLVYSFLCSFLFYTFGLLVCLKFIYQFFPPVDLGMNVLFREEKLAHGVLIFISAR